jgi:deazaflavin-dependent oxidoreductase (nitroreductase family)
MRWQRLYNPIVVSLLRSPLHGVMSRSVMLLTYRGRRSAREFTTPVSYVRDGDNLLVVGSRDHSWWKNLRGGAPVLARVRGRSLEGIAEAFEGEDAEGGLLRVLRAVPAYRRYWGVEIDATNRPEDPEALARIARDNTLVRVRNLSEARGG